MRMSEKPKRMVGEHGRSRRREGRIRDSYRPNKIGLGRTREAEWDYLSVM